MRTDRGFERLVTFSDAVVAIAVTLLVLPLVEIPGGLAEGANVADIWSEHSDQFSAFLISFVVIWSMWSGHHRTMVYFRAYDGWLMRWHMLWLLTIISLPFTTQLLSSEAYDHGALPVYIGTPLLTVISLRGISLHGRRHRELLAVEEKQTQQWLARRLSYFNVVVLIVSLVIAIVFPQVGSWPLLLLALDDLYDGLVTSVRRRRSASTG